MRILMFTDNHFCRESSACSKRGERYTYRLENQIESLNWVEQQAVELKCDKVICLGDFFNNGMLNAEEISALREIHWSDIPHLFLVGNHEWGDFGSVYNSINALSKVGDIVGDITTEEYDSVRLVYLPYMTSNTIAQHNYKVCAEMFKNDGKKTVILSHNDIKGLRYGKFESKHGLDIQDVYENCDMFINGHLHNMTQINDKMINLGNLTGLNFNEDATKYNHCIGVLDTDTLNLDLIENPHALNYYKVEIYTDAEFDEFVESVKNNAVVWIYTSETYSKVLKGRIKGNDRVLSYKITIKYDTVSEYGERELPPVKVDYREKFYTCAIENCKDVMFVKEELDEIVKGE